MEINEYTPREVNPRLQNLEAELRNDKTARFFGLSLHEISDLLGSINFSGGGVISPMFLSPGYGANDTYQPKIQMTPISNHPDTYLHEARHGLHLKVCSVIFEKPETCLEAFRLFCENVLGDDDFFQQTRKSGSPLQKKFIEEALVLNKKGELSPIDISKSAIQLGALTYQHAYFVDPRMCEAVASYTDRGMTRIIGDVNRIAASLVPYHSTFALKGYGDKNSQSMFEQSGLFKKALLVKWRGYDRKQFFKPRQ